MIIGLAGEIGCGKSTVAEILKSKHGFTELLFAKNLKDMCASVFNLTEAQCHTQLGKETLFEKPIELTSTHILDIHRWITGVPNQFEAEKGCFEAALYLVKESSILFKNPREILQFVGTEICRECYDKDFHVKVLKQQLDQIKGSVVISDARFKNEREVVTEWGGFNVRIHSIGGDSVDTGISKHASENNLGIDTDYDFVLINDKLKGIPALEQIVGYTLHTLKEGVFQRNSNGTNI